MEPRAARREWGGERGRGGGILVACLGHVSIDRAFLWRKGAVPVFAEAPGHHMGNLVLDIDERNAFYSLLGQFLY